MLTSASSCLIKVHSSFSDKKICILNFQSFYVLYLLDSSLMCSTMYETCNIHLII